MELRRSAILLFGLRILRALFSVIVLSLSAYYFGLSIERDIWVLAFNCILVLDMAIWGPVNETFRAKFIFIKEKEGEKIAIQKASSLFSITAILTVIITMIIVVYPDTIAKLIAPVYYKSDRQQLILMIRLLAPSFLINQVSQLGAGILNAYKSFYLPEVSGLVSSALTILALIFLAPDFGIYSLVISYYLGLIVLLLLLIVELRRRRIKLNVFQFSISSFRNALPFIIFALPFFLPYFAGQLNLIAEKSIANVLGPGKVSIVDYCRKFIDIPVNALSSVLTMVMLPSLSSLYLRGELRHFSVELQKMIQTGLLVLSIVIGFLFLNAHSIVSFLYGFKKIDVNSIQVMTHMLKAYSVCAFSIFFYSAFGIAMLAYGKGRLYAIFGVLAQLIMICMNLLLNKQFDILTFPMSLFLSHLISAIFLFVYFPGLKTMSLGTMLKYIMFLLLVVSSAYFLVGFYSFSLSPIISIVYNTVSLVFIFFVWAYIMDIEELRLVKKLIRIGNSQYR